ncbi:MAG: DmsC/YnfH family molybdoenzyme membrane anchor subunit [Sneathiellaceae bacterium]
MHPAASVILFTTLSGAGYGLLGWLAAAALAGGALPQGPAAVALVLGLLAVTAGLLASTFHLGRPERAWRALSQVGSSWLSREGALALLTYPAALLFGYDLFVWPLGGAWPAIVAGVLLLLCLATVAATGMIYASLKPIPAWRHPLVVPGYLLFAAASGALLLLPLDLAAGGRLQPGLGLAAMLLCLLGLAAKAFYWGSLDRQSGRAGAPQGAALGLPELTAMRPLDPPQGQPGYLQREMGFRVARKHARRLRRIAAALAFLAPALLVLLAVLLRDPLAATALAAGAGLSCIAGLLCERWLFFAEARHVVADYYPPSP